MQSSWMGRRTYAYTGISSLLLLMLVLTACSGGSNNGNGSNSTPKPGSGTPASTTVNATPTVTASPGVALGVQPCPDAVKSPSHWTAIVTPQTGAQVESVSCANLIGTPSLQALVTARSNGTGAILDVYVYNHITDPNPTQIFKLQGLYKGDARISAYNTVMTAEVDQASSINKNVTSNASLTVDLFREFKWSDGAGTLVPVTFPGLFPDLTRYQAEADQAQVNQGHDGWKLDAAQTAKRLAVTLLKWSDSAQTTIVSGGGTHDVDAVVNVKNAGTPAGTITVSLSRLEGNTNGGIWEATSVTSNGMSITSPQNRDLLSNPVMVTGTGSAFEGVIGNVVVLDHLYNDIGHANAKGATGMGNTTFSTSVSFTSSFQNGHEEGILALFAYSNANSSIAGAVMTKQLL
jgi:Immunoglobulin-like domain of bacterial spore germination